MMELVPLSEETREFALSSHSVRTQQEDSYLQARESALTRNWTGEHLDLGLPSLQNCEN